MNDDDGKRDFSELPMDILSAIADKSSLSLSDLVWFGAVCVSWRLASLANSKHIKLPSLLPVLLLPSPSDENEIQYQQTDDEDDNTGYNDGNQQTDEGEDNDDDCEYLRPTELNKKKTNTISRSLYSLYDEKVYDCQLRVGGNCRSSSHGWLVATTEADQNYSVRLLNPFKSFNNVIDLPPLTAFQFEPGAEVWDSAHLRKAVISASPSSSCSNPPRDIVVMAIHGCYRLSFCRPGDKAWTALPDEWHVCQDVIYYNGLFYAILQSGTLFAIEIDPIHSKLKDFKLLIDVPLDDTEKKYIVESSGELLQVKRRVDDCPTVYKYKTFYFKVFRLDQTGSNSKWVEIYTLNGRTLFLGHNASISLLASDFPGCKPNCIYFTDDCEEIFLTCPTRCGPHDIGIYNLEDGCVEPHYPMQTKAITPHPIWIQPTL